MADASESPDEPGVARRACDQCRVRKIRCDKEAPCSNCRTTQRKCSSTGVGQKPRDAKHRVLISHQYEQKIDRLEARLAGIEDMLRNLTATLSSSNASGPASVNTSIPTHASPSIYGEPSADEETNDQAFEGNSSMTAHTVFASAFLEQAVTSTSLGRRLNPDIQNALAALQRIVHMQDQKGISFEGKFVHRKPMPKGGLNQLPLPPMDVVLKLLREVKAAPPMTFMINCPFLSVDDFIESCRKVYFATEDYSIATFIIVNAGLYYVFGEKAATGESMSEVLYIKYHHLCRDNLETALTNLPFFLPPRKETIQALLLGVTYSIEISKFTLAWQLNSAAAALCQTLGWHRLQGIEDVTKDTTSAIFWFCYTLDKGLSLRFGRTSIFQDWDISTPRHFGNINLAEPWKNMFNVWIESSKIQGETYEHLYSPAALARPPEQRIETARLLVDKLKDLWKHMEGLSEALKLENGAIVESSIGDAKDKEWRLMTLDMLILSGEVSHWTSLTLVYRAIPSAPGLPSTYNAECIEAARMAFQCHEECMKLTSSSLLAKAGYLNWTISYAPFTPFIILFCHVIETSNTEDLQRLSQFAASLQPVLSISHAIEKLYRLCKVLHQVAALYIEAKAQQQNQGMSMVGNDFDMYLSQLGFISQQHGSGSSVTGGELGSGIVPTVNQTAQLGDWFSGNSHIMGLMEDDFLDINAGAWSSTME